MNQDLGTYKRRLSLRSKTNYIFVTFSFLKILFFLPDKIAL